MTLVLGIDPGGSTGWAIIRVVERKIELVDFGVIKPFDPKEAQALVNKVDEVVIENFRVRPHEARKGTFDFKTNDTSEIIGKFEMLCDLLEKKMTRQEPSVKPAAYGFANQKYVPGKRGTHYQDGLAHAVYYAVTKLSALPIRPPRKAT